MPTSSEQKRLDTLLGLAVVFDQIPAEAVEELSENLNYSGFHLLLGPSDQEQFIHRLQWYRRLSSSEQSVWLKHVISQAHENTRGNTVVVDENIHPSHIAKVLSKEPERIRILILRYLPHSLASSVATELGIQFLENQPLLPTPRVDVLDVVKRVFLSNFVTFDLLHAPTQFDLLSGAQLAKLIHAMGIRETAIACRGLVPIETVGAFLKRFSIDDMQAIANHMTALVSVEPYRLGFAQKVIEHAFKIESNPSAMLDFVGLLLLSIVFTEQNEPEKIRFFMQKIPTTAATIVEEQIASPAIVPDPDVIHMLVDEVNKLSETFRN